MLVRACVFYMIDLLAVEAGDDGGAFTRLSEIILRRACVRACVRLAELDVKVLEALIAASVAEVRRRYPNTGRA